MNLLAQAARADDDLDRVQSAGLGASQACLARLRSGVVRSWRTGHRFSATNELLNHLGPTMSKTLAVADLMGRRRSILSAPRDAIALDRFSEVMKQLRAAGLGEDLTRLQRGYARRVYDSLRDLGANVDAHTRAAIASLIADHEPPGRAVKIIQAVLDKLGVGEIGQSRLETLYKTETAIAYQTGRFAQLHERWDDIWGFRYVTMRDDRVRPEHAALDGTTLPKDSPFWQRYWPPNGWNCRCQIAVIYRTPGVKPKPVQPGKLNGVVPKPDVGFGFNPGAKFSEMGETSLAFAHDVSEELRKPKGDPEGGQWTAYEFPSSLADLKQVKSLGGSTGASLMEDANGHKFVVKSGASLEHAENEFAANMIYKVLGVPVPDCKMIDGKLAHHARY